jgi:hypothetical protein
LEISLISKPIHSSPFSIADKRQGYCRGIRRVEPRFKDWIPLFAGALMNIKSKLLLSLFTISLLMVSVCPAAISKTYMWEDFTKPYREKIRVSTEVEVTVSLPASFLEEYTDLPIIIEHQGIGSDQATVWRGLLKINDQSFWKIRAFGHGKYTDDPIRLSLSSADFNPGINTLRFSLHRSANASITWYTITELRFDLPDLAKYQKSVPKVSSSAKSEQPQALPPATQL